MLRLLLPPQHRSRMLEHVQRELPNEACGILAGQGATIIEVVPMKNASRSQSRFSFDPQQEIEVLYGLEDQGLELVGIYHSHPTGPAFPSVIDVAESVVPISAHLIWFQENGAWHCSAYQIVEGQARRVKLDEPVEL